MRGPGLRSRGANHADYLGHWLTVLKEDKRAIFSAVVHAQRPRLSGRFAGKTGKYRSVKGGGAAPRFLR